MNTIVKTNDRPGATGKKARSLREEVRHLWSRLDLDEFAGRGSQLRLGVCSTYPGEGTTTVAANLAIFLGEQGRKACFVETNLRRPSIADHFGVARSPGLAELMDGTARLEESIRRDVAPLVDAMPAGSAPADVYSTFGDGGTHRLFESLRGECEVLVADVPAISAAPEAGPILRALHRAMLVVQAHRTRRQAVAKSIATFADLDVTCCGIVLNRVSYDLPLLIDDLL